MPFEVLFGSLSAVIESAKGWFDIYEYILRHYDRFRRNELFLNGITANDTIARVIFTIKPELFHINAPSTGCHQKILLPKVKLLRCMINTTTLEAALNAGFSEMVKDQALMRSP